MKAQKSLGARFGERCLQFFIMTGIRLNSCKRVIVERDSDISCSQALMGSSAHHCFDASMYEDASAKTDSGIEAIKLYTCLAGT